MELSDKDLQEILDRPARWLNEKAIKILAKETLYRRKEAKGNDVYIESLEKRLSPCTCESGKCWHHEDD